MEKRGKPKTSYTKFLSAIVYDILLRNTDESHPLLVSSKKVGKTTILSILKANYHIEVHPRTITTALDEMESRTSLIGHKGGNRSGGWYAARDLEESEAEIVLMALYSCNQLDETYAKDIIANLSYSIGPTARKRFTNVYKIGDMNDQRVFRMIPTINYAIEANKQIHYDYYFPNEDGTIFKAPPNPRHPNVVSPLAIVCKRGDFYLLWNDTIAKEVKALRLDNIADIQVKEDTPREVIPDFNPYDYIKSRVYLFGGAIENFEISLDAYDRKTQRKLNDRRNIKFILQYFRGHCQFHRDTNTGVLYCTIQTNADSFFYWYLQYTDGFTVVSPSSMVDRLKAHFAEMTSRYSSNKAD